MEFYTQNGMKRPIRLCEATRQFAHDSLNRKYGLDTQRVEAVTLDDVEGYTQLPLIQKYDVAIMKIASEAPVRICEGERISGSATLGMAVTHKAPATYFGKSTFGGISHLTVDFETVLKGGINSIKAKAEKAYEKYKSTHKEPFLKSCLNCIAAFEQWHRRYLAELKEKEEYKANYDNLMRVPFNPAQNFYEAVQSIWFTFAFLRLCGNCPGIGRIDYLLGDYLKKDLENGSITIDEAREILAHFFIKGCEWINGSSDAPFYGSGDAQHYQNLVISGIDRQGNDVTNEVTYLVLDILEELGIGDYPTTVRINKNSPLQLIRRVAEVIRYGGGIVAVYNEDTVLEALKNDGYDEIEARGFANDGCWEVQIPGKTYFSYVPFDSLQVLQKETLGEYDSALNFNSFEELYQKYISNLRLAVEKIYLKEISQEHSGWKSVEPCTVISLFEEGCIEKGQSYMDGGPVYNTISPHIGGVADTVNSLYAIKKLVFQEKKVEFSKFMEILKNDWQGFEPLRQYVLNKYTYYGNDNDEVDDLYARLISDFADICTSFNGKCRYSFPAGISTFGRQLEWASSRLASPYGRKQGDVLAANCSPSPNTDKAGATAIIKSYCKAPHAKLASGSALDIRLLPSAVSGEDGIDALAGLLRGFCVLGGFFMQLDVADASLLREAQMHPDEYKTLSVRVSGWNARFITLNKEWQDMVIEQNEH